MKDFILSASAALFILTACVADPTSQSAPRKTHRGASPDRETGSAGVYSMGGTSAANPPIKAGETSAAYKTRLVRQQRERVPDAQVLYQSSESDAYGRSTNTGIYQQSGGVVEEVHIGNQRIHPAQPIYPPAQFNGAVQPGYVPAGTTAVYDPQTGRLIPVRRR